MHGERVGRVSEGAGRLLGKGNFLSCKVLKPWTEGTMRAEVHAGKRQEAGGSQLGQLFWGQRIVHKANA